jgi:hypothetical protein
MQIILGNTNENHFYAELKKVSFFNIQIKI